MRLERAARYAALSLGSLHRLNAAAVIRNCQPTFVQVDQGTIGDRLLMGTLDKTSAHAAVTDGEHPGELSPGTGRSFCQALFHRTTRRVRCLEWESQTR